MQTMDVSALLNKPLALDRAAIDTIAAALTRSDGIPTPTVTAAARGSRVVETSSDGATGILSISGMIVYRPSGWGWLFGGETALTDLRQQLQLLRDNRLVEQIILAIDSPGGEVTGLLELAYDLREVRKTKPVTAIVDCLACSAAYWLATQATDILLTPSSRLGSVGVYTLHLNHAKALSIIGIEPTFVQAGRFKTEANPYEPLTDGAQQQLQGLVDGVYRQFVDDIVRGRGRGLTAERVRKTFGEGRDVNASDALRLQMADRMFPTTTAAFAFAGGAARLQVAADKALIDAVSIVLTGQELTSEEISQRHTDAEAIADTLAVLDGI
jgi:signal peptide peptidase SppA